MMNNYQIGSLELSDKPLPPSNPQLVALLRSASRTLAVAMVILAAVVLVGRPAQRALPPFPAPTILLTTTSAWALLLAGLSLWLRDAQSHGRWHRCGSICAMGVIAIAVVAYPELSSGRPWLAHFPGWQWNAFLLMSRQAAAAFLFLGFSLLLIDWDARGFRPAQPLALSVTVIALATLLGYLYGVRSLYAIKAYPAIPIHESIALLLMGVAVLFVRPDCGWVRVVTSDTTGGLLARGMPAAVIAVPMALGWLMLKGQRASWYDAATGMSMFVLANTAFFSFLIFRVAHSLDRVDLRRGRAEEQLHLRARQRASVAELSRRALSGTELPVLMEEGVRLVVDNFAVEWSELFELQHDGLTLVAGMRIGAESSQGDRPSGPATLPRRVLASNQPIIVDDLAQDQRVDDPWLETRGIVSAAVVPVHGASRVYGVLAAYSARPRAFTNDDVPVLQTVADILAAAHERRQSEEALRLSEEKFSGVFRSSPDAIAVIRASDGRFLEVNPGFLQMTGFTHAEVIGRRAVDLNLWQDPSAQSLTLNLEAGTSVRNVEVSFRTKLDALRTGLCSTEIVTLAGEPCLLTVIRDISDRKQAQAAVQEANERLAQWVNELENRSREISLLNEMGDLLQTCMTPDEACAVAVRLARQLLPGSSGAICLFAETAGLLEAMAVWGDLSTGEAMFAPQECWGLRRGRPHLVSDPEVGPICAHVRRPLEGVSLCVPMVAQGEALGILHVRDPERSEMPVLSSPDSKQRLVVAIGEHVALALANLRLRDTLRRQSIRDELTGLYNRRYVEESLGRELLRARRASQPVGLILMDFDRFKTINDTYGHEAGDELLRAASQLFQTHLRAGDVVCRYGGEEFLFVLPGITLLTAEDRAEKIRDAVKSLGLWHRGRILGPVSASAGVVVFPDHGRTMATLLRAADTALYRAKANGGDRIEAGSDPAGDLDTTT
jgi:diguanylate cyclase (GGDEF)-like protein/PAS domain S-box-containing protein